MNGNEWRDPQPRPCPDCGYEWPTDHPNLVPERFELVEQLIRAKKALRVAETKARSFLEDDAASWLAARVVELEDGMERQARTIEDQNRQIAHLNRRTA